MYRSLIVKGVSLLFIGLTFCVASVCAQKAGSATPRREQLLNGLKVLIWNDPSAENVTIRLRIHSGSAFDPQGKEGVMVLLGRSIFPNDSAREYFREDLGGSLSVETDYDHLQINAAVKPSEYLTALETLAQAVTNPTVDKETTQVLKRELTVALEEASRDPEYVADQAVRARLLGTFPYGRPEMGTVGSVSKIDHADLIFAKDRFLSADNATLAITGNVSGDQVLRAVKRYFGSWLKSDRRVPATFQQPEAPPLTPAEMTVDSVKEPVVRYAFRGIARSDRDFHAATVFERILAERVKKLGENASVKFGTYTLPGIVLVGIPYAPTSTISEVLFARITEGEFSKALNGTAPRDPAEIWLDGDTYGLETAKDILAPGKVTVADVQRVAERLSKNPMVKVTLKPSQTSQAQ